MDQAIVADRRVEDRQSIVEPRVIIIKTEAVAHDLSGYRGWQFTLNKKGYIQDRGEPVVWKSLSPLDLLYWAKKQPPALLRQLLAEQGIAAAGSSTYILAGLLTYAYEEKLGKAAGTWPLPPEQMAKRMRRLAAFRRYKDQKGGVSDEGLIVAVNQFMLHGSTSTIILEERSMAKRGEQPPEPEETPTQIRDRLKREAAVQEAAGGDPDDREGGEIENEELAPAIVGARSESQAIRSGKGKGGKPAPAPAAPAQPKAGSKKGQQPRKPAEPAAAAVEEETTVATATKGKKSKVKAKVPKGAGSNGAGSGDLAKRFPIGARVKYIGTRVPEHTGKVAEVTGHRGTNGIAFKFKDGTTGTATPGALELLK